MIGSPADEDRFQLARPQIAGLRTAGDPEGRYRAKWQLVRNLDEIGYNAEQVREMFGRIDWIMHLRVDLEERFKQELPEKPGSASGVCGWNT